MSEKGFMANLEYYKVFYYVAKRGSLTAAAEQLYLTQPSVTKTIRRLEEQLGCELFARSKRGVTLTHEGKLLYKRVEPACRLILTGEQELEAARLLEGGVLRIASTEMGFETYVFPALQQFSREHPNVRVKFYGALPGQILEMLHTGTIDVAILHTPFATDESMELHPIDVCPECLAVGPRYAFLADGVHDLADLREYPFISMQEGSATKDYLRGLFRAKGLEFEADIEVTTTELAIQAVEQNFGIGILPWQAARERAEEGTLFPLDLTEELPERGVFALTGKTIPVSAATRVFLQLLSGEQEG